MSEKSKTVEFAEHTTPSRFDPATAVYTIGIIAALAITGYIVVSVIRVPLLIQDIDKKIEERQVAIGQELFKQLNNGHANIRNEIQGLGNMIQAVSKTPVVTVPVEVAPKKRGRR